MGNKHKAYRILTPILWMIAFFQMSLLQAGETQSSQTPADQLSLKMGNLNTYQANFEQTVRNEQGQTIDFSKGVFFIQRPNQFRWQVEQNFSQIIVADGNNVYTYDPELEQVTIQNQTALMGDSPLLMLTSDAKQLAESFEIELLKLNPNEDADLFKLTPKKEGNVFSQVHILFNKGQIAELMLRDTLGQQTSIQFSAVKSNIELAKELFLFEVPEGVDLVDSREKPLATQ